MIMLRERKRTHILDTGSNYYSEYLSGTHATVKPKYKVDRRSSDTEIRTFRKL